MSTDFAASATELGRRHRLGSARLDDTACAALIARLAEEAGPSRC